MGGPCFQSPPVCQAASGSVHHLFGHEHLLVNEVLLDSPMCARDRSVLCQAWCRMLRTLGVNPAVLALLGLTVQRKADLTQ